MTDKITFYHGTPVGGLKVLTAKKPENFDKEKRVYLTSLYPMALIYGVKNFEYTYGYTKDGEIYFDDVLIRKDGRFVLPELECLNPENLK